MNINIKNQKLALQLIGWLQCVGGIFGFGLLAYLMLNTGAISGAILLIFCVGILLFGYSTYCGKRLIFDQEKTGAIIVSIINHFLQLIQWSMLGYGLTYTSGVGITAGINKGPFHFTVGATTSNFNMSINSDIEFVFKINLLALFIILVLLNILEEIKKAKVDGYENIVTNE